MSRESAGRSAPSRRSRRLGAPPALTCRRRSWNQLLTKPFENSQIKDLPRRISTALQALQGDWKCCDSRLHSRFRSSLWATRWRSARRYSPSHIPLWKPVPGPCGIEPSWRCRRGRGPRHRFALLRRIHVPTWLPRGHRAPRQGTGCSAYAVGIDEAGDVIGTDYAQETRLTAIIWIATGGATVFSNTFFSTGSGLNNHGQAVLTTTEFLTVNKWVSCQICWTSRCST